MEDRELENPALRRVMRQIRLDEVNSLLNSITGSFGDPVVDAAEHSDVLDVIRARKAELEKDLELDR